MSAVLQPATARGLGGRRQEVSGHQGHLLVLVGMALSGGAAPALEAEACLQRADVLQLQADAPARSMH
jgi:hypothetical protein